MNRVTCFVNSRSRTFNAVKRDFNESSNNLQSDPVNVFFKKCRFRDALQLVNRLEKPTEHNYYKIIETAVAVFYEAQLSDDEAQQLCELAFNVLERKNLYFSASTIEIVDDCVLYTIYVDEPIENIFEINWELAGLFAELEDSYRDVLLFKYSSVDVLLEKEEMAKAKDKINECHV